MWLLRATAVIGGITLISRIAGLVRDQLMASIMGVGVLSDVFSIANRLPNFLRRIFAEGAFNAAFVPMFSSMLANDGRDQALDFASRVQAVLATTLIILSIIVILGMPWVMLVYAWGFEGDVPKFDLAVHLTRITFGYLLFVALTSLLSGLLNSAERYAAAAFAPTLLNLFMILALLLHRYFETPAHALAWSVLAAGVAQWVWMLMAAKRAKLLPHIVRPRLTPDVVKMLKIMAPVAFGSSVAQINLMIDSILATHLATGSISYLYFADRLNQLPLGVIGVGVGTALLPMLSRLFKSNQLDAARAQLNRAMEFTLLLALPASAALCAIAFPIIRVIYEHGVFTRENTIVTAEILQIFALGLPSFVLIKVFAPGFFANQDTKTPLYIGLVCMGLNTALCLIFMWRYGPFAMAAATTASGWVNALAMGYILKKRALMVWDDLLRYRIPRLMLATLAMTAVLLALTHALLPYIQSSHLLATAVLVVLVVVGLASYIMACFALKLMTLSELKAMLKRQPKPDAPAPEADTI